MEKKQNSKKILKLAQCAILTAIIFLLGFTPIGFLKVGVVEITFLVVPVAIGAVVLGPVAGAFLGAMFGVVSLIQCFTGSPLGMALLQINPFFTVILCIVPRVLMGFLCGLIFKALNKITKNSYISCGISSLSAALLNTCFFVGGLLLLFSNTEYIQQTLMRDTFGTDSVLTFIVMFVGLNGLVEAIACALIGFGLSAVIIRFLPEKIRV